MGINIVQIGPSDLSAQKRVHSLLLNSFEERVKQGLYFTCSAFSFEDYIFATKDKNVYVAKDQENENFLGTITISLHISKYLKKKYGYIEYVAVANDVKRMGIGCILMSTIIELAKKKNCDYLLSDTAIQAYSSVEFHIKNGFKIIGLKSYPTTNYWSYLLRRQIKPSIIYDRAIFTRLHFYLSYIFTKLTKKKDGSYSKIGRLIYTNHLGKAINK